MNRLFLLLVSTFLIASCGQDRGQYESKEMSAIVAEPMVSERSYATPAEPPVSTSTDALPQRAGLYLAYTYSRTIEVPTDGLKSLQDSHAQACMAAGPQNCLVTSSNVNGLGTEYANGYLSLKATPEWTATFLDGLAPALKGSNASITQSSTSATDLTAQIIDTDAKLKAQKTLRDRLQNLLETREGNLQELLSVERELARVQSGIDSYEANLANLRQRVAMSDINLQYQAKVSPVSQSVWRPLGEALDEFFGNVAYALSGIVNFFAYALPWSLVVLFFVWVIRKLWQRRKGQKAAN